ncbi:phosphatidylinositol 4-phosphate 3-kinase C2 domain-containing subunit gamma-like isoform X2 [Denticeps clupeoides]|uniref:phosphatidylinositol 4-phosphate 3-kinase C2 domain-containing subunit gamma-like isoform X2 n=1 Tax=Denticeps clupeoides TaxID=299321 RepID=UPI0010A43128|nr:phosphatidylinositol 4-phosphate 3-kinase C2 domain-containing subunit gamma-like isoform X2 [Denticeps clupeoides]
MKLCDTEEFLKNDEMLGMHERVQTCLKFSQEVSVRIIHMSMVKTSFSRQEEDDKQPFNLNQLLGPMCVFNTSRLGLQERLRCYSKEVNQIFRNQCWLNVSRVVVEVRAICGLLCGISTMELEEAIGNLKRIKPTMLSTSEMYECETGMIATNQSFLFWSMNKQMVLLRLEKVNLLCCPVDLLESQKSLVKALCSSLYFSTAIVILHQALEKLLQIFFDNFNSEFRVQSTNPSPPIMDVEQNTDTLSLNLASLYRLEQCWVTSFDSFSLQCSLTYAGRKLCDTVAAENISTSLVLGTKIRCNRLVTFPKLVKDLPYESMLTFLLMGSKQGKGQELLCWAVLPLYNNMTLVSGSILLSMSMLAELNSPPTPALYEIHRQAVGVILQVDFPNLKQWKYEKPIGLPHSILFNQPYEELQRKLEDISQMCCLHFLTDNEKSLLWTKRHECSEKNTYIHLVLGSAPEWTLQELTEIYTLLESWPLQKPEEALFLLTESFPDQTVRKTAVQYFERESEVLLEEFLPQLVQALKMEWELDGPLVMMLLKTSLCNIRIAQQLYWLLVDALGDAHYRSWYSKVLAALKHCCGQLLRQELERESHLVTLLTQVADRIRSADKNRRKDVLTREKLQLNNFFEGGVNCRLPLDPAFFVTGIDVDACTFHNSNAAPLEISFITADDLGRNIRVICKTGDNLKQDMLVLQIVRVMDWMWLQEGLDMRMVTYRCLSTGQNQGLIEVVPEAVTLASIHQKWGLGGALREDTLEKWFHMKNKTKEDYEEAVMNFIHSCAGWCVATFVLGICDRHNDNIMLKHTGHMFHIDFGKILGNAQKFANIKRDRTPFIFSSEMQHFITGGGENPQRFHCFVELCCEAFNCLRKRTALMLSLLQLMLGAGMPQMKDLQDLQYVHNNLRPHDSDLEATAYFTQKIKESMDSFPVKLNFLIHNMVQIPGKKPATGTIRSKAMSSSSNIQKVVIQKYTTKGRDVMYELKVTIEDGFLISEKTFGQFEMIHKRLQKHFIESSLPQFPSWYKVSFTPGRKMMLLNKYLKELFEGTCKGNEFVCSLFLDDPRTAVTDPASPSKPQIQLFMSYRENRLSVMIKHLQNVRLPNGSNPDAYVITRLRPDPQNLSKKKTKVVRNNNNPTFNELSKCRVRNKTHHAPFLYSVLYFVLSTVTSSPFTTAFWK